MNVAIGIKSAFIATECKGPASRLAHVQSKRILGGGSHRHEITVGSPQFTQAAIIDEKFIVEDCFHAPYLYHNGELM